MTKKFNVLAYAGGTNHGGEKKFEVTADDAVAAVREACLVAYGEAKKIRFASSVIRDSVLPVDNLHVQWDHHGYNGIAVEEGIEGRVPFTPRTKEQVAAFKAANT